jgi:DNA-binding NarL/FixJ family response regulator
LVLGDPEPFFSEALAVALGERFGIEVIGRACDEREAERLALELSPDVVTTELHLNDGSGLRLAAKLSGQIPVVVLTRQPEGEVLLDVVSAGAAGCLGHRIDLIRLAALLHRTQLGHFVLDDGRLRATLLETAARQRNKGTLDAARNRLTEREAEVLALLGFGLSNEAIAARLYLSTHTVRTHVGRVLRKLGVHSRAQAARVAANAGAAEPVADMLRLEGPELHHG